MVGIEAIFVMIIGHHRRRQTESRTLLLPMVLYRKSMQTNVFATQCISSFERIKNAMQKRAEYFFIIIMKCYFNFFFW